MFRSVRDPDMPMSKELPLGLVPAELAGATVHPWDCGRSKLQVELLNVLSLPARSQKACSSKNIISF